MYADDLVLISESPQGLQNCLDKLDTYTNKWNLAINLKKTKTMVFYPSGYRKNMPVFYLNNTQVELVKEYKYLGTTVINTGNLKLNEVTLKKKGLRAPYLLIHSIKLTTKTLAFPIAGQETEKI